ncbi:MAG: N-acetylmuramoyl-L-alanine amidase [Gammaproteobacteria bacterium]|nr:N-acetylmuramoyl-L-alanine amidase [Gammaproteobacteria bacterium]
MKAAAACRVLVLALLLPAAAVADVSVNNLRLWRAPDKTRMVFDISAPVRYELLPLLANPDRLVLDIRDARLLGPLPRLAGTGPFVRGVRSGVRDGGHTLRIVLDLKKPVLPRTFVLPPNKLYGHRLVIDLHDQIVARPATPAPPPGDPGRPLVIAIDAGHGGEDFGASGRRNTREKDIVLGVARELQALVDARPGMRALMTRKGDYYISLVRRVAIARQQHADLFVSLHADAFRKRSVRGSSVYALSQRGASSALAKTLADKENAADLYGGVSLGDKDDLLAKVLLDLSLTQTINESLVFGGDVLAELRHLGPVHIPRVEQAGFAVLKSPDIPSILVETAFISNPQEEKLLRSGKHQRKLAQAVFRGIERYIGRGNTRQVAALGNARQHTVRRGETLSQIAARYRVSVNALRSENAVTGNYLPVGKVLRIPGAGL